MVAVSLQPKLDAEWETPDYALISAGCGKVCVDLFVILSGFGLNHSFRRRAADAQSMLDAVKYAGKKVLKLLMEFWCVYILVGGERLSLQGKLT